MGPPPTAQPCPQAVLDLVARFNEHRDAYQQQTYNETQVRREFIDPFFTALGWDIDNKAGLAEAYKDVIHEDAIKVGGATKAPDYCFRIGGTRKFFVEAKKPAVGVESDPGPAYQLRRYGWTSKLPLSIVTDFGEFAVYDCRIRPTPTDKASTARVFYCAFEQYAYKWPEIASIFSKDAILRGSFDKYAESNRRKKGTDEVDAEFLKEIDAWRETLAKHIALRNPNLSVRDLNFAVAKIIDRIIFLRMCEDRGIETYAALRDLQNGPAVYRRLVEMFRRADEKYNSGLFYFTPEKDRPEPPDELTPSLEIDDKILKEIIHALYYPDSPYEFSVLPTEILGQVYEQFLGKVIRLTAGHRAVVEEKPEVRKAGGVYYTPTYIVDYIVKNTIGKLLGDIPSPSQGEGQGGVDSAKAKSTRMTPAEVGPDRETKSGKARKLLKGAKMMRILDPACGSGSFLLGAYQYLLDWHRDWYVAILAAKGQAREGERGPLPHGRGSDPYRGRIYQRSAGQWRLSIQEKKRILLNNIYGVDIDPQAVETTKLSLLLKVLEGETGESIDNNSRLFRDRALPDLGGNIKCGNSLIGPDFYEGKQLDMFDEEDRYRINVFDWKAEFPDVFPHLAPGESPGASRASAGVSPGASINSGFDAVIGNPPYVRQEILGPNFKAYAKNRFQSFSSTADLYVYFIERSNGVLRTGGLFGMITSNKFMRANYGRSLRDYLVSNVSLVQLVDFGELKVFQDASTFPLVIIARAVQPSSQSFLFAAIKRLDFVSLDQEVAQQASFLDDRSINGSSWTLASEHELGVLQKLRAAGTPLRVRPKTLFCHAAALRQQMMALANWTKPSGSASIHL